MGLQGSLILDLLLCSGRIVRAVMNVDAGVAPWTVASLVERPAKLWVMVGDCRLTDVLD